MTHWEGTSVPSLILETWMTLISQAAKNELLQLQQEAPLTPVAVLERARSANSALHSLFEWDDSEAARQYRLTQAAGLIRRVVVRVPARRTPIRPVQVVALAPPKLPPTPIAEPMSTPQGAAAAFWQDLDRLVQRYTGTPGLSQPIAKLRALLREHGDEPLPEPRSTAKTRTCLSCSKPFNSAGPQNRICGNCNSGRVSRATGLDI